MSIAISSALSTASVAAANSPSTAAAQQQVQQQVQQPVQQAANSSVDTVSLTEAQQVYNLYNQGQTVTQISSSLSLPVSTVNNYLGMAAASRCRTFEF